MVLGPVLGNNFFEPENPGVKKKAPGSPLGRPQKVRGLPRESAREFEKLLPRTRPSSPKNSRMEMHPSAGPANSVQIPEGSSSPPPRSPRGYARNCQSLLPKHLPGFADDSRIQVPDNAPRISSRFCPPLPRGTPNQVPEIAPNCPNAKCPGNISVPQGVIPGGPRDRPTRSQDCPFTLPPPED